MRTLPVCTTLRGFWLLRTARRRGTTALDLFALEAGPQAVDRRRRDGRRRRHLQCRVPRLGWPTVEDPAFGLRGLAEETSGSKSKRPS
jgi:hypothetical protein